jgi:hypothetical protein
VSDANVGKMPAMLVGISVAHGTVCCVIVTSSPGCNA